MVTAQPTRSPSHATVDVAGTLWPVFKLEAIAAGLLVLLIAGLIVGSAQVAVLAAAATGTATWLLRKPHRGRPTEH